MEPLSYLGHEQMFSFGTVKEDFMSLISFPLLWIEITEQRKYLKEISDFSFFFQLQCKPVRFSAAPRHSSSL